MFGWYVGDGCCCIWCMYCDEVCVVVDCDFIVFFIDCVCVGVCCYVECNVECFVGVEV